MWIVWLNWPSPEIAVGFDDVPIDNPKGVAIVWVAVFVFNQFSSLNTGRDNELLELE